MQLRIISATDTGLVRSSNQDSLASGRYPDGSVWACVCDGMGGANGGDYASSRAVEVISAHMRDNYRSGMSGSDIRSMLEEAILAANTAIYGDALSEPSLFGMGTTVVLAIVCGGTVYTAHAGDSRAYRISGDRLVQLTIDHSMVQELVDSGRLTPEQAENHPRKNVITRALGVYDSVELDFTETQLGAGDMLLLCSDGLSNFVRPDRIVALAKQEPKEDLARRYIDEACENGGEDNITAVIICE